jgi:hypothetical protein
MAARPSGAPPCGAVRTLSCSMLTSSTSSMPFGGGGTP